MKISKLWILFGTFCTLETVNSSLSPRSSSEVDGALPQEGSVTSNVKPVQTSENVPHAVEEEKGVYADVGKVVEQDNRIEVTPSSGVLGLRTFGTESRETVDSNPITVIDVIPLTHGGIHGLSSINIPKPRKASKQDDKNRRYASSESFDEPNIKSRLFVRVFGSPPLSTMSYNDSIRNGTETVSSRIAVPLEPKKTLKPRNSSGGSLIIRSYGARPVQETGLNYNTERVVETVSSGIAVSLEPKQRVKSTTSSDLSPGEQPRIDFLGEQRSEPKSETGESESDDSDSK